MNTQSHMLLGVALFGSPASKKTTIAAFIGGLIPDIAMFILVPMAMIAKIPNSEIWGKNGLYYNNQLLHTAMSILNSAPLWLGLALLGFLIKKPWLVALSFSATLHCLTDLILHHDDGHPHFWPFSDWVFSSPISYWDPAHFGSQFFIFEILLDIMLVIWIKYRWKTRIFPIAMAIFMLASFAPVAFYFL